MNDQTNPYFLPDGYTSRGAPEHFVDEELNAVWQPDLYPEAATVARRLGSRRIIDVGCGTAAKLAALHPEFEVVGMDFGSNIEACIARYDFGTWLEVDLDTADDLGYDDVAGAMIVCGDVIEHLVHPERLLHLLRGALDAGAAAIFLSTPDRDLINGPGHLGPPPNATHAREWATSELAKFMASAGLQGFFGLTRSNDLMPYLRTIVAAIPGAGPEQQEIVREWFDERRKWQLLAEQRRRKWQLLAEQQDRQIADLKRWTGELDAARTWAEEQRQLWQEQAEQAVEVIRELEAQLKGTGFGKGKQGTEPK